MVYMAGLGRLCVDLSSASLVLCRLVFCILEKKKKKFSLVVGCSINVS